RAANAPPRRPLGTRGECRPERRRASYPPAQRDASPLSLITGRTAASVSPRGSRPASATSATERRGLRAPFEVKNGLPGPSRAVPQPMGGQHAEGPVSFAVPRKEGELWGGWQCSERGSWVSR